MAIDVMGHQIYPTFLEIRVSYRAFSWMKHIVTVSYRCGGICAMVVLMLSINAMVVLMLRHANVLGARTDQCNPAILRLSR